ncbi:MAG TPA: hypothetical protein VGY48_15145 [Vicinamibacterales bacterium]|jgi:hypothetical protein|nr:hypothetical protein [Vicinamibacterales bacterium]
MAIGFTKAGASPYALKYFLNGGAGSATRSATQMIADCAAGPLKTLLQEVNAGLTPLGTNGWTNLANSVPLSIYVTPLSVGAAGDCGACGFTGGPNGITGSIQVGNGATSYLVEIRFYPSSVA